MAKDLALVLNNGSLNSAVTTALAAQRFRTILIYADIVPGTRKVRLTYAAEVREIQSGIGKEKELNVMLTLATSIKEEWLRELFPEGFKEVEAVVYDPTLRRVVTRTEKRFRVERGLLLDLHDRWGRL